VTVLFGAILVGLGLDGYLDFMGLIRPAKAQSPTALIPCSFGAVFIICGLLALKDSFLKHAMHAAAGIGLVGLLAGAGMGLPKLPRLLAGEAENPGATRLQLWMAGVCLVFVLLCVNSFVQSRRRRGSVPSDVTDRR
jgi:hypothetical protein